MTLEEEVESKLSLFPVLDDFHYGGCVGLLNIELHYGGHGNSILQLARGRVTDPYSKRIFEAKTGLTSDDCVLIADAAKRGKSMKHDY